MNGHLEYRFAPTEVETPSYVIDEGLLRDNLAILSSVKERAGCKILLALKCFAMHDIFSILAKTLDGVCASSPHEARLGHEEFGKEVHTFAAGYSEADIHALCSISDHIVFNSFAQLDRFRPLVKKITADNGRKIELALRINPEHSEGTTPLYDPCAPGSRLGIRRDQFNSQNLDGIAGLHWHNLCEQDADCLERTITAVEKQFAGILPLMRYVNFGGGHHITRPGYNVELLIELISRFKKKWDVEVYLEPGEAVALNTGYLVTTVLDIIEADMPVVIMDSAVPCHMPDVIEMPYRPHIVYSAPPNAKAWTCRIGGPSCLAGDIAGEYSFDTPLSIGEKIIFTDMAIYTMVKTNTFNGIPLPSIYRFAPEKNLLTLVRQFGYAEFRDRLS
ncbi:carboxynorspermidine decarboxylase [Pseudodesulfovibrio piezophilus]|uniref:Carboxynorspermidine/carboxyspermidine decarboxylase n=1 Tax=Pseudodesulfovibrio piezophilus (strain DSM 21447 / JCM 15486 / C1TLV30) TaxID=1322246 RepID=M1WQW7_PSEP2|nr:carboxynorspermidine decarboxylase [Pseudodesulfovibrio piezophilus]CCH47922.1 Carboxynorspermidine decarboxylase [Pseudodesulfovibrio piezophilus C1TLV30]